MLSNFNLPANDTAVVGWMTTTGYIDFYAPTEVTAVADASFDIGGSVQMFVYSASYLGTNGNSLSGTEIDHGLFPDRCQLLINGELYGEAFEDESLGLFPLDFSIPRTEVISSVGFRFYFDTEQSHFYSVGSPVTTRAFYAAVVDGSVLNTEIPAPDLLPTLTEIKEAVLAVPSTIYNFFFGESGGDDAAGFKSEVDSAVSSVDQVQQEIVDGLDKPEPEQIVPDITDIVPEEDYATYTDIFAPVVQSSLFSSMMMVVVSMAFISYVLFGKKG